MGYTALSVLKKIAFFTLCFIADEITKMDRSETVEDLISRMEIINYATYAKYRGKLNMGASK